MCVMKSFMSELLVLYRGELLKSTINLLLCLKLIQKKVMLLLRLEGLGILVLLI